MTADTQTRINIRSKIAEWQAYEAEVKAAKANAYNTAHGDGNISRKLTAIRHTLQYWTRKLEELDGMSHSSLLRARPVPQPTK